MRTLAIAGVFFFYLYQKAESGFELYAAGQNGGVDFEPIYSAKIYVMKRGPHKIQRFCGEMISPAPPHEDPGNSRGLLFCVRRGQGASVGPCRGRRPLRPVLLTAGTVLAAAHTLWGMRWTLPQVCSHPMSYVLPERIREAFLFCSAYTKKKIKNDDF